MTKKTKRQARQELLLKEVFGHQVRDFYEEKLAGDNWYVKQYNRNTDRWQVAVYTKDSFRRYKSFTSNV